MFKSEPRGSTRRIKGRTFYLLLCVLSLSLLFGGFAFAAGEESVGGASDGQPACRNRTEDIWDPAKYIGIDEVRPGMEAYCLTCIKGTEVEKFALEVLSVVRNVQPGRDWILVQCTDQRFIDTGPVAGCSGSPVYVEGRLAGAIAYVPAGTFSKDPLFGVTPIEQMLKVGQGDRSVQQPSQQGLVLDFSRPINLAEIAEQVTTPRPSRNSSLTGVSTLPCPLITSGLPGTACRQLAALVEPFGLMVVNGVGGGGQQKEADEDVKLAPGASLAVPLVTGDIELEVLGTATEVVGDKVYGFGHSFLGYGPVDLPMATAKVHTVASSLYMSFKLASMLKTVGALRVDEAAAIVGRIGETAQMIPLTIRTNRYNDTEIREYHCQLANNRTYTPVALQSAVAGAVLYLGDLPPDHTIEYEVAIGIDDAESISFKNVSSGRDLVEMLVDSVSSVVLLMNNPYEKINIKSIHFDVGIKPKSSVSHIWSLELSDAKVKAGQEIRIAVVVESFLAEKKKYELGLKIPDELRPGKYELTVCGPYGYEQFLRKAVPYRFIAQDRSSLIKALNDVLGVKRDKLYCLLVLPPGGVAMERAELPDLPGTKALVFQDARRALKPRPYPQWLEKTLETGTVVIDSQAMSITVEK